MSEIQIQPYNYQPYQYQGRYRQQDNDNRINQFVKAITAVSAGGSLLILSGLILAGTVIGLTILTPLFVIFSPVLVPAVITAALISLGFLASGGFGVAAISVLGWIYRYVTGKHPAGADELDSARDRPLNKAREFKDYGQQQMGGGHGS